MPARILTPPSAAPVDAALISWSGLVAFPTETVYRPGAHAPESAAAQRMAGGANSR